MLRGHLNGQCNDTPIRIVYLFVLQAAGAQLTVHRSRFFTASPIDAPNHAFYLRVAFAVKMTCGGVEMHRTSGLILFVGLCLSACATKHDLSEAELARVVPLVLNHDPAMDPMSTGTGPGTVRGFSITAYGTTNVVTPSLSRADVARIARDANAFPYGTVQNPIRTNRPITDYVSRMRCSDGAAPITLGSLALYRQRSPYVTIMERFDLSCADGSIRQVVFDNSHDWTENRAPSGFTLVP